MIRAFCVLMRCSGGLATLAYVAFSPFGGVTRILLPIAVETIETMDESFGELAKLLQFRDKEQERIERSQKKKTGALSAEDMEMDDWDKEMKVDMIVDFVILLIFHHVLPSNSQIDTSCLSFPRRDTCLKEKSKPQIVPKPPKKSPKKKRIDCTN